MPNLHEDFKTWWKHNKFNTTSDSKAPNFWDNWKQTIVSLDTTANKRKKLVLEDEPSENANMQKNVLSPVSINLILLST